MDSDQPPAENKTPIFFEVLAAVADTTPADAAEHFNALGNNDAERQWPLSSFFDQYVAHA